MAQAWQRYLTCLNVLCSSQQCYVINYKPLELDTIPHASLPSKCSAISVATSAADVYDSFSSTLLLIDNHGYLAERPLINH